MKIKNGNNKRKNKKEKKKNEWKENRRKKKEKCKHWHHFQYKDSRRKVAEAMWLRGKPLVY